MWGGRKEGRCWSKGIKLHLCGMNKSGGLMSSLMIMINHTVLNTGNLLRVDSRCPHWGKKKKW